MIEYWDHESISGNDTVVKDAFYQIMKSPKEQINGGQKDGEDRSFTRSAEKDQANDIEKNGGTKYRTAKDRQQ